MKTIKKKWCVFGLVLQSIGKIIYDYSLYGSLDIMYLEGQQYPSEAWDPRYVKRFNVPEEAIAFASIRSPDRLDEIIRIFLQNFPSVKSIDKKVVKKHIDLFNKQGEMKKLLVVSTPKGMSPFVKKLMKQIDKIPKNKVKK